MVTSKDGFLRLSARFFTFFSKMTDLDRNLSRLDRDPSPFGCSLSGKDRVPSRTSGMDFGRGGALFPVACIALSPSSRLIISPPLGLASAVSVSVVCTLAWLRGYCTRTFCQTSFLVLRSRNGVLRKGGVDLRSRGGASPATPGRRGLCWQAGPSR